MIAETEYMLERKERWPRKHTPPTKHSSTVSFANAEFYRYLIEKRAIFHDEGTLQDLPDTDTAQAVEQFLKQYRPQRRRSSSPSSFSDYVPRSHFWMI